MESLLRDLKFSARSLLKQWGFTTIAVITLAIGIGATTTIFSVVNGLLLRPLPGVSKPNRLADVYATEANGSSFHTFSYPDYLYYRDQNKVFDGLMAYTGIPLNLNTGAQPERLQPVADIVKAQRQDASPEGARFEPTPRSRPASQACARS